MIIPAIFSLKTTAIVAAVSFFAGAYAGHRVTQAFSEATALRLERDGLNATIADRDETILRNARLTAGVNTIAIGVFRAVAKLREAASDEASVRDDPQCRFTDDEFGRLQERIDRAAGAGAGLSPAARP